MQRPHSTEEKAWKAYVKYSQTAVSTHEFWPNATITCLKTSHPYPFTHCTFLEFISNGMRATVFSATLLSLGPVLFFFFFLNSSTCYN